MKKDIKLIALDMDGTLFNQESQISSENQRVIRTASESGIEVAISTGRPYVGLPVPLLSSIGIRYAITANGAAIYRLPNKECIYSNCMNPSLICPIIEELQKKDIHMDAFIEGNSYSQLSCKPLIDHLSMPASIREYIKSTRTFTDDLAVFVREKNLPVQKMTLNFYPLADGTFKNRESVKELLSGHPEISFLSGGYNNLEFTRAGTTKGVGLLYLCKLLGLSVEQTMACGDTENDMDIIKTAGIGVAMSNATDEIKHIADFITLSNNESGVAYAIQQFTSIQ